MKSITHGFFVDDIRDFGCLSKEIEVLANSSLGACPFCTTTKGIIVQVIAGLFQLITKAIVRVIEIETKVISVPFGI